MNGNAPRLAVVAVIGLLVLVGGAIYLSNNGSGGVGGQPAVTPSPSISPTASPRPTHARLPDSGPIEAGTYVMSDGRSSFRVTIPPGWDSAGMEIRKHRDQPSEVALYFYGPGISVYPDACITEDSPPPTEPTAADLLAALRAQQNSDVSEPAEITIGGQPGTRLEVSTPEGLDTAGCTEGTLRIWVDDAGGGYLAGLGPTGTAPVFMVETSSGRIVFVTGSESEATAADLAELQAIIDSIQFEPAP